MILSLCYCYHAQCREICEYFYCIWICSAYILCIEFSEIVGRSRRHQRRRRRISEQIRKFICWLWQLYVPASMYGYNLWGHTARWTSAMHRNIMLSAAATIAWKKSESQWYHRHIVSHRIALAHVCEVRVAICICNASADGSILHAYLIHDDIISMCSVLGARWRKWNCNIHGLHMVSGNDAISRGIVQVWIL